jgi:hypothetical protein
VAAAGLVGDDAAKDLEDSIADSGGDLHKRAAVSGCETDLTERGLPRATS